jgi:alanine dehydrogenase
MDQQLTLGLGNIHAEKGEKRAFLPGFVEKMSRIFTNIVLEYGYGEKMGIKAEAYAKSSNVRFGSAQEVHAQKVVLVLRYPPDEYLNLMQPGSCLISMCHFPTRPKRLDFLNKREINAISLDAITDDNGQRLVENLRAVAWNGCEIAFQVLDKISPPPGLTSPHRPPLNITLLGSGGVGRHAVQAAIRYGDSQRWIDFAEKTIPGNIVRVIDYDLTSHPEVLSDLLWSTDVLIDATKRKDPSQIIIPNAWLSLMPKNSVILDLSVDPYDFQREPHEVKGIEGIPQGDLDQYIFAPDDPAWDTLPKSLKTNHRRWVVSCYSWPGLHPRACMIRYGNQLSPLIRRFAALGGVDGITPHGRYHDRALARGLFRYREN